MGKIITAVTHNGNFHADDVCAVAALKLLLGNDIEIIRSRDPKVWERADYVVDVGDLYDEKLNRFDHHQAGGAGKRDNGIPYASFGLIWKKFGERVCGSRAVAEILDRKIVQYVDAMDNGVDMARALIEGVQLYDFSDIVESYRPTWKNLEDKQTDEGFDRAVSVAGEILGNEIARAIANKEGEVYVEKDYREALDKRLVVLDGKGYPWQDAFSRHDEILFVVQEHSANGTWRLDAVRKDSASFAVRKPLPASWAGKRNKELAKVTGVSDATFCHNGRHLAVARTKDGALKLAKLALNS